MDVARFKYPPFWVPVEALWDSMEVLDRVTGMPRGYFIVSTERHESGAATAAPGVGKEEHVCGHDHSVTRVPHSTAMRWRTVPVGVTRVPHSTAMRWRTVPVVCGRGVGTRRVGLLCITLPSLRRIPR